MSFRFDVRTLVETDWEILRSLRLAALEDAPDSFGTLLASAVEQDESYWRSWASGRTERMRSWVAYGDDGPVGLVSCGVEREGVGHAGSLWVDPRARCNGLGRRLLQTARAWLQDYGCHRIELEVTDGNPAERLYLAMGFRRNGATKALREGSKLVEATMALEVVTPPSKA